MSPDEYESYTRKLEQKLENAAYSILTLLDNVKQLEAKVAKLKSLLLLTDPAVSSVEMNELSMTQWSEYTKAFPEES